MRTLLLAALAALLGAAWALGLRERGRSAKASRRAAELAEKLAAAEADARVAKARSEEQALAAEARLAQTREEGALRIEELKRAHSAAVADGERRRETLAADALRRERELALGFEKALAEMRVQFQGTAAQVLEGERRLLQKEHVQESLRTLEPLREEVQRLQRQVESVHKEETEQRRSLAQEIQAITLANRNLGAEAQALATALQGRAKLRGNWGEIQLENVLKGCGLKEGVDYLLQGRGLELRFPEGGRALPDALVRLPEGWLVIDAKTRLPDFLDLVRASEAGDGAAREAAARALGAGIRVHAEELSRKDYGSIPELGHGVPTLMFVAPEAALWEAAQADPGLFEFAQDRGIYLCTASGLWASLRALHHVAQMGRRSENIEEIARTAQRIAAQVLKAREEMEGLREAIARLLERHDAVQTRLFSGRENVQRLSEKLEVLGLEAAPKARRKPRLEDEGALRGSKGPEENPETPPELGASGGVADAAPQDGL